MFIPTTLTELNNFGWQSLDIILISGDSYIDSPYSGVAVVGKVLIAAGYKVGIIAQPDITSNTDITRLGEPTLFWGVTAGTVDSMVANYTATQKKRRSDDFTPGGVNNRRPDRAAIAYTNLIKRYYKNTCPIVLGGIEASLRRVTHYDYWDDRLRAPLLFDSKADFLLYGMAEKSIVALASALRDDRFPYNVRGLCYLSKEKPEGFLELPTFEECVAEKSNFRKMFEMFYHNNDPITARGIAQKKGDRYCIQNPPSKTLSTDELDQIYSIGFQRAQHPFYEEQGSVKAIETIRFSIPTHRGCYGECNFCAIAVHEGRTVASRSNLSILNEAREISKHPQFNGTINDLSGPTANMFGFECAKKLKSGACEDKRCVFPEVCPVLKIDHSPQIQLLKDIREIPGIKHVFIGSGIRYDMVLCDKAQGSKYFKDIVFHHTSGQLKVAPEHSDPTVLKLMGKPAVRSLIDFRNQFESLTKEAGKKQFLTYYFIAAYPGCSEREMKKLHSFASDKLQLLPEQVQVFTPTPSTYASVMYYTETDPFSGEPIFVEKNLAQKNIQKEILMKNAQTQKPYKLPSNWKRQK